jgi:hypothetical protein
LMVEVASAPATEAAPSFSRSRRFMAVGRDGKKGA